MPRVEQIFCRSAPWRAFTRHIVLPWATQGADLKGRILEIGGGSGAMAAAIAKTWPSAAVTLTDYDPAMVNSARKRLKGSSVEVRQADATDLPFADGSFDVVASFIMLHHVGRWKQALAEAGRVLRPGGILVGYDLLNHPATRSLHQLERAQHQLADATGLRSALVTHPFAHATVQPGLGGLVARFRAQRQADGTPGAVTKPMC